MFSYNREPATFSPFLLLDYAGPLEFTPSDQPRGVEKHPHRGFETVTIAYQGDVEHKDSAGNTGKISPGDVQWMTAGRGILHEEMHGRDFTAKGGMFEMIQLWVNLPTSDKMSPPAYQELSAGKIPVVTLDQRGSTLRVIAGHYEGTRGPARTFTPVTLWDIRMLAGHRQTLPLPAGDTAMAFLRRGHLLINDSETANATELVVFERDGDSITLEALEDTDLLFMGGEPIDEPVVGQGPFVMNTRGEIQQAIRDYHAGRF
jgi:redox-sensitive bicupin YhaK (pirin superfamily)